jgi:RHS repeat-associated protein
MAVGLPDGRQIEYRVDAYGRRLAKLVNGTVVRKWLYADGLLPVAELDANDNLISVFNGSFMVRDGETYRIITDHVGSPRLVVNASTGEVTQQLTYDEWGNVTEDTNPGFQPFGFAGGLYDPDTGLVRFGARDYDALAGRWTTKDPVRFLGGAANLYVYCQNNPVNFRDPLGLCEIIIYISEELEELLGPGAAGVIAADIQGELGIKTSARIGRSSSPGFQADGSYIQNVSVNNSISGWGKTPPGGWGIPGLSDAGSESYVNHNRISKGITDYRASRQVPASSSAGEMTRAFLRNTVKHETGHGLTGWAGHPGDDSIMDNSTLGDPGGGVRWSTYHKWSYGKEAIEAIKSRLNCGCD